MKEKIFSCGAESSTTRTVRTTTSTLTETTSSVPGEAVELELRTLRKRLAESEKARIEADRRADEADRRAADFLENCCEAEAARAEAEARAALLSERLELEQADHRRIMVEAEQFINGAIGPERLSMWTYAKEHAERDFREKLSYFRQALESERQKLDDLQKTQSTIMNSLSQGAFWADRWKRTACRWRKQALRLTKASQRLPQGQFVLNKAFLHRDKGEQVDLSLTKLFSTVIRANR